MGSDFYRQFETPLGKAVDKAIAEANEGFLSNPGEVAAAQENGERWRRITEAEQAVGPHAVVLPVALAKTLLDHLEGRGSDHPVTSTLAARMLTSHLNKAEERK